MNFPEELLYSKSHEWVRMTGETALVGLTDFAQHELGDLVFVNLPEVGEDAAVGERLADVESVKAVSDVFSPLTGAVKAVNEAVLDAPELINSDPYGTWLFEIENITEKEAFLDAAAYARHCEEEKG